MTLDSSLCGYTGVSQLRQADPFSKYGSRRYYWCFKLVLTFRLFTDLPHWWFTPVILVPVNLLWRVRLSIRKKLALGGIFSITVVIIAFAIIRLIAVTTYSLEPDESWLHMWSSIEQAVCTLSTAISVLEVRKTITGNHEPSWHSMSQIAIMVACLASFPSLFKKSEHVQKHWVGGKRLLRLLLSPRSWSSKSFKDLVEISDGQGISAEANFPEIPGGTMTGVRSFINKQGKTASGDSQSTPKGEDEDCWRLSEHVAHSQVWRPLCLKGYKEPLVGMTWTFPSS